MPDNFIDDQALLHAVLLNLDSSFCGDGNVRLIEISRFRLFGFGQIVYDFGQTTRLQQAYSGRMDTFS